MPSRADSDERVVVAQLVWSLGTGGLERVVVDLVNRLDPERFASVVYCLEHAGELAPEVEERCGGVDVLEKKPGVAYGLPIRLARLFQRHGVAVLHCHNYGPLLYGAPAARLTGTRVVYTTHGAEAPARRAHATLQRLGLVHQVVAVSDHQRARAVDESGIDAARVATIHNGIDASRYRAADETARERARADLGIGHDQAVVGIVARLTPEKDHASLLDAFARVCATVPRARLVIVGDGEIRADLEARARELDVAARVSFLGTRQDVPQLLPAFDVFALSSRVEGLGITLLEAMASGLPTVSTRAGGIPEIVVEGQTGLTVPTGDASALADAISRLLGDRALARRMGLAGRARVESDFNLANMVRAYEDVYERVWGAKR